MQREKLSQEDFGIYLVRANNSLLILVMLVKYYKGHDCDR